MENSWEFVLEAENKKPLRGTQKLLRGYLNVRSAASISRRIVRLGEWGE